MNRMRYNTIALKVNNRCTYAINYNVYEILNLMLCYIKGLFAKLMMLMGFGSRLTLIKAQIKAFNVICIEVNVKSFHTDEIHDKIGLFQIRMSCNCLNILKSHYKGCLIT